MIFASSLFIMFPRFISQSKTWDEMTEQEQEAIKLQAREQRKEMKEGRRDERVQAKEVSREVWVS